jgi:nucleoside-diphosphate kinase
MEGKERSFVMVKPDGVALGLTDEIVKRLEAAGLTIVAKKELMAPASVVEQHYTKDPDYLLTMGHFDPSGLTEDEKQARIASMGIKVDEMRQFIQSGLVVPMIVEGPVGTVAKIREIVGKTNPPDAKAADPHSIRGEFGTDSYELANAQDRSVRNIVHASGNVEEAEGEIAIWQPLLS